MAIVNEDIGASASESSKMRPGCETTARRGGGDATDDVPIPTGRSRENVNKYGWMTELRNFLHDRRLDLAMWITRLATIFFITFGTFPLFGMSVSHDFVRRALICNAATSALRLHQRIPQPYSLNRQFFGMLIMEDSFHYLMYSLIFLFLGHVSFALIPIFLFATLHAANFHLQMLHIVYGPSAKDSGLGYYLHYCKDKTDSILKMAASAEVCLMCLIIINCFGGRLSIATPLIYYRFLKLRYVSKRNHYTRQTFFELRRATEHFMASGNCPSLLARVLRGFITLLCKLSPI